LQPDLAGTAAKASVYGDVRPDHLLKQAQRIRLMATTTHPEEKDPNSIKSSNRFPQVPAGLT
jgi:hypothetical protein